MKIGIWKTVRKAPVLLMALAVSPAAMADGWLGGYSADNYAPAPSQPAPAASPSSSPILTQPSQLAPTEAPAAPMCAPMANCAPVCDCSPGCPGCGFSWGPDHWCNVGAGIRTSFNDVNGAGNTDHNYFAVDEARLFFSGKVHQYIGFELNTDISGAGGDGFSSGLPDTIHLLDAVVKFEFSDYINFWVGRFLPPSDRSNLSGPFFINDWDYPFVSNYPGVFEGRDDGVAYWGQVGGGRFKWQFGLFNGQGRFGAGDDWPTSATGPNTNGNPEFAMRLVLNLLDPEPGYYNSSTYYGQKNICAIGFALMDQNDALTDANHHVGSFLGWNVDFLLENKMTDWGSGTLELAYYDYSVGGDVENGVAGKAGMVFAGWLLPHQFGCCGICGRLRPYFRYQMYNHSDEVFAQANSLPRDEWDVGTQYVICGHNARLDLFYGQRTDECGCQENIFRTGLQIIF